MSKIRTSLHGRLIGLNHNDELQVKGAVYGQHGKQTREVSPHVVSITDDFIGNSLNTNLWLAVEGTDSATSDASLLSGGIGGVLRLTTGDAGTGLAADQEEIVSRLQWQASNGGLAIQGRLRLSRLTNAWAYIGFTDKLTLEGPVVSAASGDTVTTNATDAVGFMFDSRNTTQNWFLVGVANNVDAIVQNSLVAPVASIYQTFRIEVDVNGQAVFFINGQQVGTAMVGAVTAATDLTPVISVANTSGTVTFTMDVDYVHVTMDRGLDGTATNN